MSALDLQHELAVAVDAVRAAARVCRRVQGELISAETLEKKDKSPVTVADFAAQALVCAELESRSAVPTVIGEESAGELREAGAERIRNAVVERVRAARTDAPDAARVLAWIERGDARRAGAQGRCWTLDPIDGTKGFLRNEHYAIALALLEAGELRVGVLACPRLVGPDGREGALLAAVRGAGAFQWPLDGSGLEGRREVRVAAPRTTAEARFCESVESDHSDQGRASRIAQRLGIAGEAVRVDSQAKYAIVARGEASIYLRLPTRADYREKIWDHAAGALLVEEAGGRVSDVDGKALDFACGSRLERNRGIIATSGAIHAEVVAAVRASLAD